jgi:hypothetical protein
MYFKTKKEKVEGIEVVRVDETKSREEDRYKTKMEKKKKEKQKNNRG